MLTLACQSLKLPRIQLNLKTQSLGGGLDRMQWAIGALDGGRGGIVGVGDGHIE